MYPVQKKPLFILAPMFEVTDTVFRQIVVDCAAPDIFFTEFVNVDGLQSKGRSALMKYLRFSDTEKPLVAQVWGTNPDNFYKTAKEAVAMGFAGVDINMGCPVKNVVKKGCCSGLIENRDHALEIIRATNEGAAGKIPVSVKTRLGFREVDFSWHELLLRQNLSMLTVHGRTAKQMSTPPADWEAIKTVREIRDRVAPETLLIGNGDIESHQQGLELANRHGLDGVMVGRGIFHDPFIFADESPWESMPKADRIALYKKHVQLFAKTWEHDDRPVVTLNKFCKIYINGFDGAKEIREQLMQARSSTELLALLDELSQTRFESTDLRGLSYV
jgi:nifR3 family TIM-barrel protein